MDATATKTVDLDALREQAEAAELRARIAVAEAAERRATPARRFAPTLEAVGMADPVQAILDSSTLAEAWGDLVDPTDYLRGDPSYDLSAGRMLYPSGRLGDRQDGRNYPIVQTEADLLIIRATARLLADTSPAAIGIVSALQNYIIGSGFDFKIVVNESVQDVPAGLTQAVQAVVDENLERNDFLGDLDRELCRRSRRDGEFFLASYAIAGGNTALRVIEPEQVTEPKKPRDIEDAYGFDDTAGNWAFGIHTAETDIQTVYGYHVQWNASGTDWDYLPAEIVTHCKLNVDRNIKRGIGDFYPVRNYLDQADKILRNSAAAGAIQAAIAWIREHVDGAQQAQVETMRANDTSSTFQRTSASGLSATKYVKRYEAATIIDSSPGMKHTLGPAAGENVAAGFIAIEQAVLRYAGMRWNMPEYLVSGDASNANYSSTLVAESPFVRYVDAEQTIYRRLFGRVVWKIIKNAFDAGRFAKFGITVWEIFRSLIELQITVPEVAVRDDLKATKINEILKHNGILSPSSWASREGLDYGQQVAQGAKADSEPVPGDPYSKATGAPAAADPYGDSLLLNGDAAHAN